jgi:hypothetical protein
MAIVFVLLAGAAAWIGPADRQPNPGDTRALIPSTSHIAAAPIAAPIGSSNSDDSEDEKASEIVDPLASLAYVAAGDLESHLREFLDEPHLTAESSPTAVLPPSSPSRPKDDSSAPASLTPESVLTHALPTLPTLAPAACAGACPLAESRKLGTALEWASSVEEAAQQAKDAGKLVFVIHVSGNFESPGFT